MAEPPRGDERTDRRLEFLERHRATGRPQDADRDLHLPGAFASGWCPSPGGRDETLRVAPYPDATVLAQQETIVPLHQSRQLISGEVGGDHREEVLHDDLLALPEDPEHLDVSLDTVVDLGRSRHQEPGSVRTSGRVVLPERDLPVRLTQEVHQVRLPYAFETRGPQIMDGLATQVEVLADLARRHRWSPEAVVRLEDHALSLRGILQDPRHRG